MDQLVAEYPAQLREAMDIGRNAIIRKSENPIHKILVCGMGGSGIGGTIASEFVANECPVPILTCKGYKIPKYVDKNTLVVVSSYSGNTEETYEAFEQALTTGAKIICVASGGKIIAKAKEEGLDHIEVPAGSPSPRACLGYSYVQQLWILHKSGFIGDTALKQVESSIALIEKESEDIKEKAKRIAPLLVGKIPIIYSTDRMEGIAIRFRQQVNENAKMLCWHHVVPEMNHNELVGWVGDYSQVAVVYFRNKDDYNRNQVRIDINQEIIRNSTSAIIDIWSKGDNLIERANYFIHLGDWISVYMAEERQVDSIEVNVITHLKNELAKV